MSMTAEEIDRGADAILVADRRQQLVTEAATALFNQTPKPSWITYFRQVFGVDGVIATEFADPAKRTQFEKTLDFTKLQRQLAQLRASSVQEESTEPTRVITVRLPKSIHEALRDESHQRRTSMNQLCITKLLQTVVDVAPDSGTTES